MAENGFGTAPLGFAPFGFWSPPTFAERKIGIANARALDPRTKDLLMEDGRFLEMGGVQQKVFLAITTKKGSVPGLPDFGVSFVGIEHKTKNFKKDVQDSIRVALQPMITRKEIKLLEIIINESLNQAQIDVLYMNLSTKKQENVKI